MTNEELVRKIQDGNEALLLTLWKQVERYVAKTAIRWYLHFDGGRGVEVADLIQSGYLAMIDAVQTFEDGNGSFVGWLTYYLQTQYAIVYGIRTERTKRDPLNAAISLDAPIGDEDGMTVADTVVDPAGENGYQALEDMDYNQALREALEKALADIPPKNADVIRKRYLEGQAQGAIATAAGVSPAVIHQRERKGFSLLRKSKTIDYLREFSPYGATGFQSWKNSGLSVEEKYVIWRDEWQRKR